MWNVAIESKWNNTQTSKRKKNTIISILINKRRRCCRIMNWFVHVWLLTVWWWLTSLIIQLMKLNGFMDMKALSTHTQKRDIENWIIHIPNRWNNAPKTMLKIDSQIIFQQKQSLLFYLIWKFCGRSGVLCVGFGTNDLIGNLIICYYCFFSTESSKNESEK